MLEEKTVFFKGGKWKGSPVKGQITPRKIIGVITDEAGQEWEVLSWLVRGKSSAAQFHVRANFTVGRNIFFSSERDAKSWMKKPMHPTLGEIKEALAEICKWHEPSRGLIQVWVDFKRV